MTDSDSPDGLVPAASTPRSTAPESLFRGGGRMGERMRAFDWDSHPLGSPRGWPLSLVTALRMMLSSGFPMFVWWSRELYMFHNDAYMPSLGGKSWAPGGKAREVWYEIMDQLGSVIESVLSGQDQFYFEELLVPLERKSFTEETYWTFSYSPVPDDDGNVGGLFCSCAEVTGEVLGKRRLKTINDIAGVTYLHPHSSMEEACQTACGVLAANAGDLPYVLIYLLDPAGGQARLAGKAGALSGTPPRPSSTSPSRPDRRPGRLRR